MPPAGAAFAQGLGLGLAANFRVPASAAAGLSAVINDQIHNGTIGGLTFNREALAITGGIMQVLGLAAAILGIASGPLGWAALSLTVGVAGLNVLVDPAIQSLLREHLGIDVSRNPFGGPCEEGAKESFNLAKSWVWPRDPIIDLDGDGLETVGLAANIRFDFDADGVLTKTALLNEFKVRTLTSGDDNTGLTDKADIMLAGETESRRWRGGISANNESWRMMA